MSKNTPISDNVYYNDKILRSFIEDPTKSVRERSKELGSYRQKVWRRKKKLENENIIWGYTSIIDESKFNHVMYLVLMKMEPMSKELANILNKRLIKNSTKTEY